MRKRMLIVDDVPQNRAMLMDTLHALGFIVADARNGQECLDMLDRFRPDLVVIDVTMPVMDGHEATRRIRQSPDWGTLPVIAVTASASHEDELKCYASGANAFIAKPVDFDILLDTIGAQLQLTWIEASGQDRAETGEEAEDLVIPPAQEIAILYQLARIGNMQKISERADYLHTLDPAYAPFAKRLHALAQGYHSKALTAFVARYHSGTVAAADDQ
jgi:CheY-like chemotaxis protein